MKKKSPAQWRKSCVLLAKRIALERDRYVCQKCGRTKNDCAIHASHVYPEGKYHDLSADPENIKALCFSCHFLWWHKNPIEAHNWFKEKFPERYKSLRKKSLTIQKKNWEHEYIKLKVL